MRKMVPLSMGAMDMFMLEGLSERAKIGKILIAASLIIRTVIVCVVVGILFLSPIFRNVSTLVFVIFGGLVIIMICVLLFGVYAFFASQRGDFNAAGMYALIGSALPPLDVVMAAGAIFCLISGEAANKTS